MTFIPNTPNERNDYKAAIKAAMAKLATAPTGTWFVVTNEHLKRNTDYNAQGAFQGFDKLIKAGKLPLAVAKGADSDSDSDRTVVALSKA
jgi:hypothetical protein